MYKKNFFKINFFLNDQLIFSEKINHIFQKINIKFLKLIQNFLDKATAETLRLSQLRDVLRNITDITEFRVMDRDIT